jgi:histidyl-tRNA synthetase
MQFDADTVGSASPAADAEMCMMAADTMEALGIKRGDYVVKVNSRKILDSVIDAIGLHGKENELRRLTVLRAMDKLDKLGMDGVRALLGEGRKDESGDFTRGAGLSSDQILIVTSALMTIDVEPVLVGSVAGQEGRNELAQMQQLFAFAGYGSDRIRIDPSVVRGLEYYTGAVFEVELTFETKDEKGRPVRFGSVGGGGRYDGLVSRFRGEPVPATGFSVGVSRLLAALQAIKSPIVAEGAQAGPVLVTVLDHARLSDYQRMVQKLRDENIRAELYLGSKNHNLGQQLKYADKRRSPCAIIQGSNEKNDPNGPQVLIKDLAIGAQLAGESTERGDYLQKQAQAQFAVKEEDLVDAVRELLARHSIRH